MGGRIFFGGRQDFLLGRLVLTSSGWIIHKDYRVILCIVVCFFLGSRGRKNILWQELKPGSQLAGLISFSHFLLPFASVMRRRRTFDRDGQTDRQTDRHVIFIPT